MTQKVVVINPLDRSQNFGPYDQVVPVDGGLECDGAVLSFCYLRTDLYSLSNNLDLAPLPPVAVESIEEATARIHSEFEAEMRAISSQYPNTEREGWPQQQLEATAYQANPAAVTPILDAMVAVTGEDKAELAASILAKVAAYSAFYGAAVGRRRQKAAALQQ